jgi:fructoselysine and glucoselysine-specific PTS system IIB component
MIKLLRVDSRLLHGQIAVSWVNYVGTDCILVAGDNIDPMVTTTMKLSKPAGVKLVIKTINDSIAAINEGKTDPYRLFILVENVTDAYRLAKACPAIKSINVGRTKKYDGMESLNNETHVTFEQKKMLKELLESGYNIVLQMIPTSKAVPLKQVL